MEYSKMPNAEMFLCSEGAEFHDYYYEVSRSEERRVGKEC